MKWSLVSFFMELLPEKTFEKIRKSKIKHPLLAGAEKGIGLYRGQIYDYRISLKNGKALHIQEFDDYYEVHIDQVDPKYRPIEHLRVDAPEVYVVGASAAGATIGAVLGGKNGAVIGALAGLLFGLSNIE